MMNREEITTMEGAIKSATKTIEEFFNPKLDADKQIPLTLLQQAHGLAFLTVVKAGFIWTGKIGAGLVISKLQDGRWSAPSGIGTAGVGFGAEVGAQVIHFMIILSSSQGVQAFMEKAQLSGGVNAEFAAGIYGRAAGMNANVSTGGDVAPNYTYSHSKGLFGGVGIQGSAIGTRGDLNKQFYGREISPAEILAGAVDQPAAAVCLYDAIEKAYRMSDQMTTTTIPPAVTGSDVQIVYDQVLRMIESYYGGNEVEEFKTQCKTYGQETTVDNTAFFTYLEQTFTQEQLLCLLPDITRLLPQERKRNALWTLYNDMLRSKEPNASTSSPSLF